MHECGIDLDLFELEGECAAVWHRIACVERKVEQYLLDVSGIREHLTLRRTGFENEAHIFTYRT